MKKNCRLWSIPLTSAALLLTSAAVLPDSANLCAQTVTNWTGAANNSTYNDAANWDNGVPTASTPGFISGAVLNPFYGRPLGSEDTESPLTLDSNVTLTLNGGTDITLASGTNASGKAFNSGFTLNSGSILNIGTDAESTATAVSTHHTRFQGSKTSPAVMNVNPGSTYTSKGYLLLGTGSANAGTLNVYGTLQFQGPSFTIGDNGTGIVNIYDGAVVTAASTIEIGNHSTASGTLNLWGGTLTASGAFRIGGGDSIGKNNQTNTGTVNYYSGTITSTYDLLVGCGQGATGNFNIKSGADFTLEVNMRLGNYYSSTLKNSTGNLTLEAGTEENPTTMQTEKVISVGYGTSGNMYLNAWTEFTTAADFYVGSRNPDKEANSVGTMTIKENGVANINKMFKVGTLDGKGEIIVQDQARLNLNVGSYEDSAGKTRFITSYIGDQGGEGVIRVSDQAQFNIGNHRDASLFIGEGGTGKIYYNSSAVSTWLATIRLGYQNGTGEVYIQDGHVKNTDGYFIVGHAAKGVLEVSGDAQADLLRIYAGDSVASTPGTAGGTITVKDSAILKTSQIFLADKNNTFGTLTVQDSAQVSISDQLRIGTSQHYTQTDNVNYQGGGQASLTLNGGSITTQYFHLGNSRESAELNILSGTFTTSSAKENWTYGSAIINLAGGEDSTITLKGKLNVQENTSINITEGTSFTGTDLAFSGENAVSAEGLYSFANLSGTLTFAEESDVDVTIYMEDVYLKDGSYQIISAANSVGKIDSLTLISSIGETILSGDSQYLDYSKGLALNYSSQIAPLPEPGTWTLLLIGLGIGVYFRAGKRKPN